MYLIPLQILRMPSGGLALPRPPRAFPLLGIDQTVAIAVESLAQGVGLPLPLAQHRTRQIAQGAALVSCTQGAKLADRVQGITIHDHRLGVAVVSDAGTEAVERPFH